MGGRYPRKVANALREDHIFDFYAEYERIRDAPSCDRCEFRRDQQVKLLTAGIELDSAAQRAKDAQHKGYVRQATYVGKARRSPKTKPSCWYCDRLGDAIIALSAPAGLTIVSGDWQSFPPLAEILGKPLVLIPSLVELRKRRDGGS